MTAFSCSGVPDINPRLVAELDALDVPFLQGAEATTAVERMPPGALLAALAANPEARLRLALVPLLLRRPDFATHVRAALDGAAADTTAQLVLKCYYTAARYLQQKYRLRLEKITDRVAALPDLFSAELGLPAAPDPDAGLQSLAQRHAALSGKAINWLGTYEHAAQRWLAYMERRQAWTQ